MKRFLLLPCLPLALLGATYNVRDFGATGDGKTKDTAAFQRALDACAVGGGGEVTVPAGTYLIGSVQLGQRTMLHLLAPDSVITGSADLADYPMLDVRWEGRMQPGRRALIHAANTDHIAITGPGRIEGHPEVAAPQNPRGVVVLEAINCTDVHWEGFTVTQGGNWATHPTFCTGVVIKDLTIRGRRDGIDVDSCRDVRIEHCDIETGDDAISLKSGRGLDGARLGRPTEDVVISDCRLTCTRFAAIGIGSETSGGVRRVRIEHCRLEGRTHGIYFKARPGRAGVDEDLTATDLDVFGGGFLRINLLTGGNTNTADDPVPGPAGLPGARRLSFANIRLHDVASIVDASQISPEKPVDGFVLAGVTGTAKHGLVLTNMINVSLADTHVTGLEGSLVATRNVTGSGLEQATAYKERVVLWNGRNLDGWHVYLDNPVVLPSSAWSARDGVLHLDTAEKGYLRTEREFSNYHLHVEWRWTGPRIPANSNSGVMVHVHGPDVIWPLCFECQLKNGNAGQVVGLGLDIPAAPLQANRKRAPRLADPSEKPPGEWNTYEIFCRGDSIECLVNGVRQNRVDQLPARAGAVALQMEGFPIEFRNVWLEEL